MNKDQELLREVRRAAHITVERMDCSAAYDPFSLETVKVGNTKYAIWMRPSVEAMEKMRENVITVSLRLYDAADSAKHKMFFPIPRSTMGIEHKITQEDIDRLYLEDCNVSVVNTGGTYYFIPNRQECTEWDVVKGYIMLGRLPYSLLPIGSKLPDLHSVENAILVEARIKALQIAQEKIQEQLDILTTLYDAE